MKYRNRFNEDFQFYFNNRKKFTFCGQEVHMPEYDVNGVDAKAWFHILDSTGKSKPCKHPRLAKAILRCKKSVNWQIKEWVQGYDDCLIGVPEYLESFINPPCWIVKAFRNSLIKSARRD